MKKVIAVILALLFVGGYAFAQDKKDIVGLKAQAEQGDAAAMKQLGVIYHNGDGVNQDYQEALKWYMKAAELGNAQAFDNLGWMYQNGQGVSKDMVKALEFYMKGAEGGVSRSLNQIGWFYENGFGGLDEDYEKATEYYLRAAEQGYRSSQYHLGMYYAYVKHDDAEALKWFEKAASQNHVIALRVAGNMYKTGSGTKPDYKKAYEYYTKAIELAGDSWAQAALGNMYERGLYVKKNIKKAFELYKASAEQGNVRGQCNLGYMYANGSGVRKNLKTAREWFEKAANNESNGDGARDDAKKALKQLKGK